MEGMAAKYTKDAFSIITTKLPERCISNTTKMQLGVCLEC